MRLVLIQILLLNASLAMAHNQLVSQTNYTLNLKVSETEAAVLKDILGSTSLKATKEDFSTIRSLNCTADECELQLYGEIEKSNGEILLKAPPSSADETATNTTTDATLTRLLVDASYKNKAIKMKQPKQEKITPATMHVSILEAEVKLGSLTLKCGNRLGLWTNPFILQSFCTVQGSVQK